MRVIHLRKHCTCLSPLPNVQPPALKLIKDIMMPSHTFLINFSPLLSQGNVRRLCFRPWFGLTWGFGLPRTSNFSGTALSEVTKGFVLWIMSPSNFSKCCGKTSCLPDCRYVCARLSVLWNSIFRCFFAMQKCSYRGTKSRENAISGTWMKGKLLYESAARTRALTASPPDNAFDPMCHKMMHGWQLPLYRST